MLFFFAYAYSTYPIAPLIRWTYAATPSLPLPPTPSATDGGSRADLVFHSGLTFDR